MQNKNLKQQQAQQQENQKAQFLNFVQGQDKTSADYINMITSSDVNRVSGTQKLEAMEHNFAKNFQELKIRNLTNFW